MSFSGFFFERLKSFARGAVIILIGSVLAIPLLYLSGTVWRFSSRISDNGFVRAGFSVLGTLALGEIVRHISQSPRFRGSVRQREKTWNPLLRFLVNVIFTDFRIADLAEKEEVMWEVAPGVYEIGSFRCWLDGDLAGFAKVVRYTTGMSPGNGFLSTVHKDRLMFTGRTGADLFPDLIRLGLGGPDSSPDRLISSERFLQNSKTP